MDDVTQILDPLNDAQREAVTANLHSCLILAGAGSGKTRVLVHRVAWLVHAYQCSPYALLAVTFTNKAAAEMRGRLEPLMDAPINGLWVGTFHSLAHRMLRQHWQEAKLSESFQVIDSDDQYRLIRRVLKQLQLDEKQWPPRQAQWYINQCKDEGLRPEHIEADNDLFAKTMQQVYSSYQQLCQQSSLVDFAELLLRCHEMLRDTPHLLSHYRQRFQHILVDEFQDTNVIQYAWLRLLAGDQGCVFAVGDDDQSIYGWRGAKIENIQQFQDDFKHSQLIRLQQNYRSTGFILKAANSLITHNANRLGKELWTDAGDGEPISLYAGFNEVDEARFVVERIQQGLQQGYARSEMAILYRSNAQSRVLEEALLQANLPYRIYGGQKFFERAEIKDALGYLRLVASRHDDAAFERVVNTPTRGIGERTLALVREQAREQQISLWQAAQHCTQPGGGLTSRAASALGRFTALIEQLAQQTQDSELHSIAEYVIANSGLIAHFQKEKGEKGQVRIENLDELVSAARQFEYAPEEMPGQTPLMAFVAHAALEAGDTQADAYQDSVQLMTLHSAKGLEFPLVFLVGVEEGLFPHSMSTEEPGRLEEERRLCYVGITRAMRKLYLSYAESRRIHGQEKYHSPSRFLRELPSEVLEEVRMPGSQSRWQPASASRQVANEAGVALGQRVRHERFGEGTVLNCEGQGPQLRVHVNFDQVGSKWLVLAYAKLQPLS